MGAPLDPSKVKAGDTITIKSGPAVMTDVVKHIEFQPRGWIVHFDRIPNGYWVDDADDEEPYRLTDHQPAPKPEWKPGTTGTATVRTVPNIRVMRLDGVTQPWVSATFFAPAGDVKGAGQQRHDDWQVTDFVPDETRPLPTIPALAEAIVGANEPDPGAAVGYEPMYLLAPSLAAGRVWALLRSESR